jgi:hypothetical protein
MTRDDIIRLAQEVDAEISAFIDYHYDQEMVVFSKGQLERFAALVAAPLKEKIKDLEYQLKEARNE